MSIKNKIGIVVTAIALISNIGCKVSQPAPLPHIQTPTVYADSLGIDSTSLGDVPWKQLFTDPYLVSLIDTALQQNLDLKRAMQRITIARNQYYISKGALLPRVDAEVTAGVDKYGRYTQSGVGNYDTNLSDNLNSKQRIPYPVTPDFFAGLRSTWELDIWGKLKNLKKAAYARFLASQKGEQLIKTSLVAEVASRYYQLLALDNELAIIQNNIRLQDSALEIVKIQKQAARANELAVEQFRAQLLHTMALKGITLQQITETENEINMLLGRYPQPVLRDTSLLSKTLPVIVQAGVPAQLLQRRPDIQQAELELVAAKADVNAARAAFYPTVTLTPYVGMNAFKLPMMVNAGSLTYGILGGLTAPVFHQGMLRRNLSAADAARMDAYYAYQQAIQNGVREVVNSLSSIQNLKEVYRLKEKEAEVLNQAVITSNLLFKTGYASYLEVITAQRSVIDAELQLVHSKEQMFYSLIALYRALGGGWK
jgi:NodT family efflux transporter outer membrane factor (OMF) lipoprotein